MNLSKLRLILKELMEEENKLLKIFFQRKPLIKGGVYQTFTRCGNKGCKCMREGKLHQVFRLYFSEKGKNKIKTLNKSNRMRYERLTKSYKRFRSSRARLVNLHKKQMRVINSIEKGLIRQGEKLI